MNATQNDLVYVLGNTRSTALNVEGRVETNLLAGIQRSRRFKLVEDGRFRVSPGVIGCSSPVAENYLALIVFAAHST